MEYKEFIKEVQQFAGLATQDEAVKITEATLETLGERLFGVHRRHLAAQLPKELKPFLLKRGRIDRFGLEEFYGRVAARTNIRFHDAYRGAKFVMCVLRETVAPGELKDILSELPKEYDELLSEKVPIPLPPPLLDTHTIL